MRAQPSDPKADKESESDGGEDGYSSENEGPGFMRQAPIGQMPADHEIGRREIGRRKTRRNELRQDQVRRIDRRRIAKFERGLAYAGAFVSEIFQQLLMGVGKGGGRRRKNFEDSRKLLGIVHVKDRDSQD